MDTSPERIKMCEKAVEIQALINLNDWLNFWCCYIDNNPLDYFFTASKECTNRKTWLPTQAQLQGMVVDNIESSYGLLIRFLNFLDTANFGETKDGPLPPVNNERKMSMEQLWLAFVMHEKFGKVWNGKNWENVSRGT